MLVTIEHLDKYYGADCILKDVSCVILEGRRIGLVGANGEGKTTLLNIIAGVLEYDAGEISADGAAIGYLQQNEKFSSHGTILEEMRAVFAPLLRQKEELEALQLKLGTAEPGSGEYSRLSEEYSEKNALFEQQDGYLIDVKINTVLNGMGFRDYDRDTRVEVLSGGEKTRLAMARLLLIQPDLLILDEPTNHLDFRTLSWLEEYLSTYKGAILVVSHDRYFLDRLVGEIWELENKTLTAYPGNYSAYVRLKKEKMARWQKEYDQQQEQIRSMEDYIQRNIVRATTSKMAKSRRAALERMERIEKPVYFDKRAHFVFTPRRQPVKDILHVKGLSLSVGEGETAKELCRNVNLDVLRGEKVALIGPNGVGKSSLLKALQGMIPCRYDQLQWGRNVDISFFEQENRQLSPEKQAIQQIWDLYPRMYEQEVRSLLGQVLLRGEEVFKKVSSLSGGERARLAFCLIMLEKANVLILDEPTNHLDIGTKEQLEDALAEFDGTILMVSHDRYLLNKIPTSIIEMSRDGLTVYPGNYDAYVAASQKAKAAQPPKPRPQKQESENAAKYYRSKKDRSHQVAVKNRIAQLEKMTEELERELRRGEEQMGDPAVAGDYQKLQELCDRLEELRGRLDACTEEWMELSQEAETF